MVKKIIVLSSLLLSFSAQAINTFHVVPQESTLTFIATQNNAPIKGEFKNVTGDIQFDPNQLSSSQVDITVDMSSVNASYADLVTTLKTADWFNVASFPKAIFKANHFTKVKDNQYQAVGTLTLRDKTEPVTVQFSVDQYSDKQAHAVGQAVLKRTQFGVGQGEWADTKSVKDEVKVEFSLMAKS